MFLISGALAEAAQEAPKKSGLDILLVIDALLAVYFLVTGLMTLFTGKLYGSGSKGYDKYTEESVKAAIPWLGGTNVAVGIFFAVFCLEHVGIITGAIKWVLFGVCIAAAVLLTVVSYKKLKLKEDKIA